MSLETVDRRKWVSRTATDYLLYPGREALLEGPTRSAKSWSLMYKADIIARNFPGSRQLIARQTRKSLNESILKDWRDEILWQGHPAISPTASRDHQDLYVYPLSGGKSEIYFCGLDTMQDTSSPILSTKWDRIYVVQAEEIKESAWETLATRLSSFKTPYHQMTADANPAAPSHWLNKRFGPGNENENRKRFRFRHYDNPLFYSGFHPDGDWTKEGKEYVDTLKATLTGVRYKRFYLGQWAAADGLILDNWDPEKHIIDGQLEKSEHYGWLIHVPGMQAPIRVAYFTAGVDWGWHPDPGAMSLWAYDSPRWHKHTRRYRIAEVVKLKWQREQWAELAEHWQAKYGCRQFSCDRSNPEAINYFNLRLGKKIGRSVGAVAIKCPPIGGGHRQERDKGSQIDLMREGLGSSEGHQRTFLFRNAFPEGLDEELRRMGRPTCSEEEIESWIYKRKPGTDKDEGVPDDDCDEHCLTGDAEVLTEDGLRRIDCIRAGEYVVTPYGMRVVEWAGETHAKADVFELATSIGSKIRGTGSHVIWTGRGWIPLDAARSDDIVLEWVDEQRLSWWMASGGADILTLPTGQLGRTFAGDREEERRSCSTDIYGARDAVPFRVACTSTIATEILETTRQTIWSWSPAVSIPSDIPGQKRGLRLPDLILSQYEDLRQLGTLLQKDLLGIQLTESMQQELGDALTATALSVELDSRPNGIGPNSVQISARGGATTKLIPLITTVIGPPKPISRREPVFDLTVDDAHCFLANGILVSNSLDAWRYDEVLNFARGFGQELRAEERAAPDTYAAEWARHKANKKRRDGRR